MASRSADRAGPPPTRHGQPFGLVTSALQKAIRRGDEETALRAAAELDQSGFTAYVWFRLMTIASEDVGLADSNVIVQVNSLHDAAMKAQQRPRGDGTLHLMHAVLAVVRAPKSRIVDHAVLAMYRDPQPTAIPDVAFDKHTREGRQRGRGWEHFWEEGALLVDQATGELSHAPVLVDRYRNRAIAACGGEPAQNPNTEPSGQLRQGEESR